MKLRKFTTSSIKRFAFERMVQIGRERTLFCGGFTFVFYLFLLLVTMAKGIGNGFPMAAVITTPGRIAYISYHQIA